MPTITRHDVEHVAQLARLTLPADELARFTEQLAAILQYVGKLGELKTDGVMVTAQVTGLSNITRADQVVGCDAATRERLLSAAPERSGDFIQTRGVFA
ncbi:MAG: Asp-tRNA(Asn)/Glu-tRNA(Gln) amidotransferase subunit GatC [bacterium]|nr:Asp-tRNA(Asn)/Glu-tRNA(Gln) amidotransferase subunit GatC [bacterium]